MGDDEMSGAEELRAVVGWIDYQREDFNDRFSLEELVKLWRYGREHNSEVNEFADTWTDEQIQAALGKSPDPPGCFVDGAGAHYI